MLYYTTLFLVFWALIYTSARFLQYYRIVKNYKDETEAVVRKISDHVPAKRRESPANDILLEYEIGGEEIRSEIVVPREQAAQYQVGSKVGIRYYVEENGAVAGDRDLCSDLAHPAVVMGGRYEYSDAGLFG